MAGGHEMIDREHWRDEARRISDRLHRMSAYQPCETACIHVVTGNWTILGLANVAARATHEVPVGGEG